MGQYYKKTAKTVSVIKSKAHDIMPKILRFEQKITLHTKNQKNLKLSNKRSE
jgi:hypothetical protein